MDSERSEASAHRVRESHVQEPRVEQAATEAAWEAGEAMTLRGLDAPEAEYK
jgi:hypothetical protein